jgi:hypothetical protein
LYIIVRFFTLNSEFWSVDFMCGVSCEVNNESTKNKQKI